MTFGHKRFFMNRPLLSIDRLFFSLDRKEPKGQDCQKKSENSAVRVTSRKSGMKLVPTSRDSNNQNFYVPLTGIFTDFF